MRTFILFITAGAVAAFAPQPRQLLSPATTQMTTAATAVPVAASRAVHKSIVAVHAIDATSARRRAHRSRASTALAAARKKTEDMTEEEKAAEKALNQQLLVAKGVLFVAVIGYFAFTSL